MNRTWIPIVLIVGLLIAGVLLVNTTQTLSTTQSALTAAYVTATAGAVTADGEATRAAQAGATAQAGALNAAANAAATSQANALRDAANEADTAFSATRVADRNAAATAQSEAVTGAEDMAATAQVNALQEAAQAAATLQANGLANIRNAQATALANAVAQAQSTAAAEQVLALQAAQETAAVGQASVQSTASAQQDNLQATIAAQSTLLATAQPTAVPASAGNAAIPDGWVRIEGYEVALWMPPTWQGGDFRKNSDAILDIVEGMDPGFAQGIEMLRQNPDAFRLYALDTAARILGEINLNIITQPLPFDLSVELLMPSILSTLPDFYDVLEDDIIEVNGDPAGVIVADIAVGPLSVRTIQFFMVRDGVAWVVSLTTGIQDAKESRAFAEQIIQTIEFFEAE